MMWKKVQITLLQLIFHVVSAPDNKSYCIAYPVNEHDTAKVTFYFSNLNTIEQEFEIQQNNNIVLSCEWYVGKLECIHLNGFELENPITNKVVLKIPEAKLENAGPYKLHVFNGNPENEESCYLEVREKKIEHSSQNELNLLYLLVIPVVILMALAFYCWKKRQNRKQ